MHPAILTLLAVVAVSTLGGLLLIARKDAEKPVKAMLFVAYFWFLAFGQLLLLAGGYFVWQHFLQ